MANREDIVLAAYQSTPQAPGESKGDWESRVANKAIELSMALNNTEHSKVFQKLGDLDTALHNKGTFSATIVKMKWEETRRRVRLLLFSQKNKELGKSGTIYVDGQPKQLPPGYEMIMSPTVWDNHEMVSFLRENAKGLVGKRAFFVKHNEQYEVNGKSQKNRTILYVSVIGDDDQFEVIENEKGLGGVIAKEKSSV